MDIYTAHNNNNNNNRPHQSCKSNLITLIRYWHRESLDRDYDVRREDFNGFCDVTLSTLYSPIQSECDSVESVTSATKFFLKFHYENTLEFQIFILVIIPGVFIIIHSSGRHSKLRTIKYVLVMVEFCDRVSTS